MEDILFSAVNEYAACHDNMESKMQKTPKELENDFRNQLSSESFRDGGGTNPYKIISSVPQLFCSLLAASMAEDTIEEGDFRKRLSYITSIKNIPLQLTLFSKCWNVLAKYLQLKHKITLNLPDPGRETQIGIPKRLVFPKYLDGKRLLKWLSQEKLSDKNMLNLLVDGNVPREICHEIETGEYDQFLKDECSKKSEIFIEVLKRFCLFERNVNPLTREPNSVEAYYRYDCRQHLIVIINTFSTHNIPLSEFLTTAIDSNNHLMNYVKKQTQEGIVLFVEENGKYRSKQYLPPSGAAILFIRSDIVCAYDGFETRNQGEVFVSWSKIDIRNIQEFKEDIDGENQDILEKCSVFLYWYLDRLSIKNGIMLKKGQFLVTRHFSPEISYIKRSNSISNDQGLQAHMFTTPSSGEHQTLIPSPDGTTYTFPYGFSSHFKQGLQKVSIKTKDGKKLVFEGMAYIPEVSLKKGYKSQEKPGPLIEDVLCDKRFSNKDSITQDKCTEWSCVAKRREFYPELFTTAKPTALPKVLYSNDIEAFNDEREHELYEVLAAKYLRKRDLTHTELMNTIRRIYNIGEYQCWLGICSLIENGVLDCIYRSNFTRYIALPPSPTFIGKSDGTFIWRLTGLLAHNHRKKIKREIMDAGGLVATPYYDYKNKDIFSPSGATKITMRQSVSLSALQLEECPSTNSATEILHSWGVIFDRDLESYNKKEYWNSDHCRFEDNKSNNDLVKLVRLKTIDQYRPNHIRSHYAIISEDGEIRRTSDRTWAIIVFSLLTKRSLFNIRNKDVYSEQGVLLPTKYVRHANLLGGYSSPIITANGYGYCYNGFAGIYQCTENHVKYKPANDYRSAILGIASGNFSFSELKSFRER